VYQEQTPFCILTCMQAKTGTATTYNVRKERLHAVTTIWFTTSMIIPTFFVQLKSNWDGISGEPDDKRRIFGTLKGVYGKITKDTEISSVLYAEYRNAFAYNEWVYLLISDVGQPLVQRPQKKLSNAGRRNINVDLAADIRHIAYEMHGISRKLEQMETKINSIETVQPATRCGNTDILEGKGSFSRCGRTRARNNGSSCGKAAATTESL
jgi:hypothetical protein